MTKRAHKTTTVQPVSVVSTASASPAHPITQRRRAGRAFQPAQTDPAGDPVSALPETGVPRLPSVSVLERRLIDPDLRSTPPVRLKDRSMHVRWVNVTAYPGRYSVARAQQGWEPVRMDELEDANEIPELVNAPDGLVRRGERGQEVLMKMPEDYHQKIQQRKVEKRQETERSSRKMKETVAAAVADRFGPEASEYVDRHMKGEILETTERLDQP